MDGSVTNWLNAYREGDREAAQKLWNRYYRRLVQLARSRLRGLNAPLAEAEDIALEAFEGFCRGVDAGRLPAVCDRTNLWNVLFYISVCKVRTAARYETCRKRNAVRVSFASLGDSEQLTELISPEPSPELAFEMAERLGQLLTELPDGDLREIAILRMEGHSNADIGELRGCSESTIDRKLRRIRQIWSHHVEP